MVFCCVCHYICMKQFYEVCVYTSLVMCGQEELHIYTNIDVCICVCPFVCLSLPLSLSPVLLSRMWGQEVREDLSSTRKPVS